MLLQFAVLDKNRTQELTFLSINERSVFPQTVADSAGKQAHCLDAIYIQVKILHKKCIISA